MLEYILPGYLAAGRLREEVPAIHATWGLGVPHDERAALDAAASLVTWEYVLAPAHAGGRHQGSHTLLRGGRELFGTWTWVVRQDTVTVKTSRKDAGARPYAGVAETMDCIFMAIRLPF